MISLSIPLFARDRIEAPATLTDASNIATVTSPETLSPSYTRWQAQLLRTRKPALRRLLTPICRELKVSTPTVTGAPKPRPKTAWLDGLRGYAALLVVIYHFCSVYWNYDRFAWGTNLPAGTYILPEHWIPYGDHGPDDILVMEEVPGLNRHIIQLPIIRLLTDGDSMVVLFFLVSGYSLSIKPLSLIRKGLSTYRDTFVALSSASLRRPIRLILPMIASTLFLNLFVIFGLYNYPASKISMNDQERFHYHFKGWSSELPPVMLPTWYLQLYDWVYHMSRALDVFQVRSIEHLIRYDIHLWTIPEEFQCSFILFITLAGTALMSPRLRLIVVSCISCKALLWDDKWIMSLFWAGMMLAEIDMIYPPTTTRTMKRYFVPFIVGLFLLSTPINYLPHSPCYNFLLRIKIGELPSGNIPRIWQTIGAIITATSISRCQALRTFFSNRLARYLGRISFALYLVHGGILRCVSYSVALKLWRIIGHNGTRYNMSVALTALVAFPTILLAAGVFTTRIDEPAVRLARWADAKVKKYGSAASQPAQEEEVALLPMDTPPMAVTSQSQVPLPMSPDLRRAEAGMLQTSFSSPVSARRSRASPLSSGWESRAT